jgi:hypothetical protein
MRSEIHHGRRAEALTVGRQDVAGAQARWRCIADVHVESGLVAAMAAGGGAAADLRKVTDDDQAQFLRLGPAAQTPNEGDELWVTVAAVAAEVQQLISRAARR